ncbi:F-box protein At3g07870-like [Apium graveolens]|uniref:F-box protein At3g07870-like n=1 Tax=Apium graveolens TaxID=4045 RepID=UPI003D7B2FC7
MDLPEEIVADILSRLPIKTILHCKCLCKRWCNLLLQSYFVNLHLSRSPPALLIRPEEMIFQVVELFEKSDHRDIYRHPQIRLDLRRLGLENNAYRLNGSVNGLICLSKWCDSSATFICNPVTQECIELPVHKNKSESYAFETHGFGFVEASNEYKVVCFLQDDFPMLGGEVYTWCKVYTLGTGVWRSLGRVPFVIYGGRKGLFLGNLRWHGSCNAMFVNGNLHWLVYHKKNDIISGRVCTFDLKKEVHQLTALPEVGGSVTRRSLELLGACLCVCDRTSNSELVIWVMKDYRIKENWSREIIIRDNSRSILTGLVHPLTVLKDGTIVFRTGSSGFTYQPGSETLQTLDVNRVRVPNAIIHVPSFIKLKSFVVGKV